VRSITASAVGPRKSYSTPLNPFEGIFHRPLDPQIRRKEENSRLSESFTYNHDNIVIHEVARGDGRSGADDRFCGKHQDYSTHRITFPFPIRTKHLHLFHPFSGAIILQTTIYTEYDTLDYIVSPRQIRIRIRYGKDILSADQRIRKGDSERIRLYGITITLHDYTGSLIDTDTRFCLVDKLAC